MVVQWLELCAVTAKGPGSIPRRRTKMPQTVHNPFKNLQDLKKNGCGFLIYDEELNIPIYLLFFPDFY